MPNVSSRARNPESVDRDSSGFYRSNEPSPPGARNLHYPIDPRVL
jgi:hypothetical protein